MDIRMELVTLQILFVLIAVFGFAFFLTTLILFFRFRKFFRYTEKIIGGQQDEIHRLKNEIWENYDKISVQMAENMIDLEDINAIRTHLCIIEAKIDVIHMRGGVAPSQEVREKRPYNKKPKTLENK